MKKISLLLVVSLIAHSLMAQDIDEVRNMTILSQFDKAKVALDKYMAVPKNAQKADGWFYKAFLLNQQSKDSSKSIDESSAMKLESFETFKKYRQMDAKATLLEEYANSPLFDLYSGFAGDLAIRAYNAKNTAAAYDNFKKGIDVHDYVYNNNIVGKGGYKFPAVDTTITLYAGLMANELKKQDEAAVYFKKITDANISGADYIDAYQVLVEYFKNKKDKASFDDVLAKGKKFYPKNDEYWTAWEIEAAVDGIERPAVFVKYDELLTKYPNNYNVAYNYGVELYQYLNTDVKPANAKELNVKLIDVLKKAIAIQSTLDANYLLANTLYNTSFDIGEEARKIKGVKPEDIKKKKGLEAEAQLKMDQSIPYAQAAQAAFATIQKPKSADKVHYKQVLTMLKNIFEVKKNTAKVAEYTNLIKSAE